MTTFEIGSRVGQRGREQEEEDNEGGRRITYDDMGKEGRWRVSQEKKQGEGGGGIMESWRRGREELG
eukprot:2580858-Pyramimonas_sp.AAC.1